MGRGLYFLSAPSHQMQCISQGDKDFIEYGLQKFINVQRTWCISAVNKCQFIQMEIEDNHTARICRRGPM